METAEHPHSLGRRLRTIGVVAGLVVGGLGALAPAAYAQGSSTPSGAAKLKITGAVPTTVTHLRTGSYGPAFAPAASTSTLSPNVVGGTTANTADYPGVVGIETYFVGGWDSAGIAQWYKSTCTGTVVSPTKVLTAGHCVVDSAFGHTYVIAGRNNLDTDTTYGYVADVATTWTDQSFNVPELYASSTAAPKHDVSVLTLKQALPSTYTPVSLSAQGDQTPYVGGTSADVVGYGVTGPTNSDGSPSPNDAGVLHKGTLTIQPDTSCGVISGYDATTMTCAGTPDQPSPVAACHGDSGGPLFVAGKEVGITDWGSGDCTAATGYSFFERLSYYNSEINVDMARHGLVNLDWTGDGASELFTRDSSGYLKVYSGGGFYNDGANGFAGAGYPYSDPNYMWTSKLGSGGWNIYNKLFRVTNWNNDGTESVMGRDAYGKLWQYKSDGYGAFAGSRVQVGSGWGMFSDIMVTNNWTGDGHPNILGRTSTGDLYLYTSNLSGGWENGGVGIKIGTGWNMFNTVLTPGDWKGDGHQALIGRTSTGDLRLYESDGHGGWVNGAGVKIGTGWSMFNIFMSPGDWNGDDCVDLIGITPGGYMYLYTTDGKGNWITGKGQTMGSGWSAFNQIY